MQNSYPSILYLPCEAALQVLEDPDELKSNSVVNGASAESSRSEDEFLLLDTSICGSVHAVVKVPVLSNLEADHTMLKVEGLRNDIRELTVSTVR